MAPTKEKSPKVVTVYGRLSFPTFTAQEAFARSQTGKYPAASPAEAAPDFQLLLEQSQHDKLMNHIEQVFLPYCVEQEQKGEKRDVLSAAEVKKILVQIKDLTQDQDLNTPIKPIHEKTAPLAPECVSQLKVIGNKGVDMELKAIVNDEDELKVPDPDLVSFPIIKPIGQTVHSMFPGCYVAVTLNLYAYHNGKFPGFSAGGSTAVFKMEGERFGGGTSVDEDEIFAD